VTGTGGTAGTGGSGGAPGSGGNGGTSGCVPNLACKPTAPPSTGDLHQDCVDRINQFLTQCACLPALARATDGEACADQMAAYDAAMNSAHAGTIAKICTPSGSQNECPGYSSNSQVISLCMQQMWDEGPPPTSSCTGTCYEQHGHYINMTDPSVLHDVRGQGLGGAELPALAGQDRARTASASMCGVWGSMSNGVMARAR
jgi:hypothetical protein